VWGLPGGAHFDHRASHGPGVALMLNICFCLGVGFRVQGLGFGVESPVFSVLDFGFRIRGSGGLGSGV